MERRIPPSPPFAKGGVDGAEVTVPPFEKGGTGGIPPNERKLALTDFAARLKPNARNLRKRQTDAEQCLWRHLRRDQLSVRFLRQRPLGRYIVDFYAPKARLVVELDGSQHMDAPAIKAQDEIRDAWLRSQGLQVLRFDDRQVLTETQAVLEVIFQAVGHASVAEIPPSPPFPKGGENLQPSIEGSSPCGKEGEPQTVAEGSPPLKKGGQRGFSDASTPDEGSM
jgi:very-short-patch-repair endonuclease